MAQPCPQAASHDRHAPERRSLPARVRAGAGHRHHRRLPVDGLGVRDDDGPGGHPRRPVPSAVSTAVCALRRARLAGRDDHGALRAVRDRRAAGPHARPGRERGAAALHGGGAPGRGARSPTRTSCRRCSRSCRSTSTSRRTGPRSSPAAASWSATSAASPSPRSRPRPPARPRRSCSSSSCSTRCSSCSSTARRCCAR